MSLAIVQLRRFLTEAKMFLLRQGRAMPTEGRTVARAKERMGDMKLGAPAFKAEEQIHNRPSNVDAYNENVRDAKFDVETFILEATDQSLRLLRNFSATFVELQRISNQVDNLMYNIAATEHYRDGYKYIVGDSFRSLAFIDGYRSTVTPDLSTGKITLQTGIRETVDLGFLATTASPQACISQSLR